MISENDIKSRFDKDNIEKFHLEWELEHIIDLGRFSDMIFEKVAAMSDNDESDTEFDYIIFNSENGDQYDIDIEFDHEDGSAWIYPTAYGKRLEEDGECVLHAHPFLKLDDSFFNVNGINNFINDWLLGLKITVPQIVDKIHEYTDTIFEFPMEQYRYINLTNLYEICVKFVKGDYSIGKNEISEYILLIPMAYGQRLDKFACGIYERTVKNDRS